MCLWSPKRRILDWLLQQVGCNLLIVLLLLSLDALGVFNWLFSILTREVLLVIQALLLRDAIVGCWSRCQLLICALLLLMLLLPKLMVGDFITEADSLWCLTLEQILWLYGKEWSLPLATESLQIYRANCG